MYESCYLMLIYFNYKKQKKIKKKEAIHKSPTFDRQIPISNSVKQYPFYHN